MPLKPIKLAGLTDIRAIRREIKKGLDAAARGAKRDFEKTVATFTTKPKFTNRKSAEFAREISTDNLVYTFLDEGTKAHDIAPKKKVLVFTSGYWPKTKVRVIGSQSGARGGDPVFTRKPVHHPGTQAREFSTIIEEKWQAKLKDLLDQAMKDAFP